jgi:hypothetical protein
MSSRALEPSPSPLPIALAGLVALTGFALATWLFSPGMVTHDALAVYDQAYEWRFGDWQPPLMGVIWRGLETLFGYGPRAILLPTLAIYWLAFFLLFVAISRARARSAWLVFLVAFLPPIFALTGVIWRDVIFSALWLFAFSLAFCVADRPMAWRALATALALMAFLIGYWLRPNALFAAVPLLAYLIWPTGWRWTRAIAIAVPVVVLLQASSDAINYRWLHAKEDHATHSIFVFDLAGITHFSGKNAFPIDDWTPDEFESLKSTCYQPNYWDAIWWVDCTFAMERINRDDPPGTKLFGSDRLRQAWLKAILEHPLAYVKHRLTYFWTLLGWENMVLFDQRASGQWRFMFPKSTAYAYFETAILWLHRHTPIFRGLPWLLLSLAVGFFALRCPDGRAKAACVSLTLSGTVFTLTYLIFGVAAEYRYVYWTALSSLIAGVIMLAKREVERRVKEKPT